MPGHPVLIVNPRSGGGKALRQDAVGWCRENGVRPVVMAPGDDVAGLAAAAVADGADVLGMAGGDGSMAAVAAVAAQHDIPMVVVPAGTRNHFALDLGLARRNLAPALRAFFEGSEYRVDLARVNGRTFVNNASLGLYGAIVRSKDYRDAKLRTVVDALPRLVGPGTAPFDLRFTAADGHTFPDALVLLVSNNPYEVQPPGSRGSRRLDGGTLGIVILHAPGPGPVVREWTSPTFRVDSGGPVDIGLDGEAMALEPPLCFESVPGALRVRVPGRRRPAPGRSGSLSRGSGPSRA